MRQQRIDELTRRDHYFLSEDDVCYFFGEYSARNGRTFSDTNELTVNLSMPAKYRGTAKWARKERAVHRIAQMFRAAFAEDQIGNITFVPLPSHPKERPEYEDRMRSAVRAIGSGIEIPEIPDYDDRMGTVLHAMGSGLDVRAMIEMIPTPEAIDLSSLRMGPDALFSNMRVVQALLAPEPRVILLVADVLVTGANFVAAKRRLHQLIPKVPVHGLFAARKLLETDEFDNPARY